MRQLLLALLIALVARPAFAGYVVAVKNAGVVDHAKPTHLLVTGRGSDLKYLFQQTAAARAERYLRLSPNHQVVLITHDEADGDREQTNMLKSLGFKVISSSDETLDAELVLKELTAFTRIATLDIYSHTSALYGAQMGGGSNRIGINDESYAVLKSRFMKGAYAILHGCNSGYYMAPFYAEQWGIPVQGSLTSTDFERRHVNGNFYRNENDAKPSGAWSSKKDTENYRMKPDNWAYHGVWGAYQAGGLGFMKTFCPGALDEACEAAMAESLMSFSGRAPANDTKSKSAMMGVLKETMCPTGQKNPQRFIECAGKIDALAAGREVDFSPFQGHALECDFRGCQFKMEKCESAAPGSTEERCELVNLSPDRSGTWVREVQAYLRGLDILSRNGTRLR